MMVRRHLVALGLVLGLAGAARADADKKTPGAIKAAADWLARHQSKTGRWDASSWQRDCTRGGCRGRGTERGDDRYHVGVTGLAVQALVAAGHTHQRGVHKAVVAKAVAYLKTQQKADGSIGYGYGEQIYNHAIATQALADVFRASKDPALRAPAQRAATWCLKAQNPGLGWKYGQRTGRNDTSVTGWMTQALASAARAGLVVPPKAFKGAQRWFRRATASNGDVGYQAPGGGMSFLPQNQGKYDTQLPSMTAMSVYCRVLCGERRSEDTLRKGIKILDAKPPLWQPKLINGYYWLAGTHAMRVYGGAKRKAWDQALSAALLPNQATSGCAAGSWDPVGPWCLAGGRVFFTAANALALHATTQPTPTGAIQLTRSPHNGQLDLTEDHIFEVVLKSSGVVIYLSDANARPIPLVGVAGTVRVEVYPIVKDVYKPLYKARGRKKLTLKQLEREAARRRKWEKRIDEKSKPRVKQVSLDYVPADPAAGRTRGYLFGKVRVGGRFDDVRVSINLKNVPGKASRADASMTFEALTKPRTYNCDPCKLKHVDPGPCGKCGKPVR